MKGLEDREIVVRDGLRIRVQVGGTGPVLILLHGFSGSGRGWDGVAEELSRQHRLVLLDLPGHGQSDKPVDALRYRMDEVVADVEEVASRFSPPVDLLGYSMGGRVALATTVWKPHLVRRLILESASPGLATSEERAARVASDEALADRISTQGIDAFLNTWEDLPLFRSLQSALSEEDLARLRAQRRSNDADALAAVLRGLGTGRQPSFWPSLSAVAAPTLLITGRLDEKFARIAESMSARLPLARHLGVPGAGHRVHLERPRHWLRAVGTFLSGGARVGPVAPL